MGALLRWAGHDEEPAPSSFLSSQRRQRGRRTPGQPIDLPAAIGAAVWHADQLGSTVSKVVPSGFEQLDRELPSAGWPCHSLTEVLQPQPTVAEWRLLAPAVRQVVAAGQHVVIVGPPKTPHLPGLRFAGLDERHLIWVQSETPSERLWVTEQLIKANVAGLLIAWLPQARQEQIRRLQVCAQGNEGPIFLCRPAAAQFEPSAAPLRIQLRFGMDWQLHVHLLKRKGPTHEGEIALPSIPGGLESVITPRLRMPSEILAARRQSPDGVPLHVVGVTAPGQPARRSVATP